MEFPEAYTLALSATNEGLDLDLTNLVDLSKLKACTDCKELSRLSYGFVDDQPESLDLYGLDNPVARIWLVGADEQTVEVWIGGVGEPEAGLEGHPLERRYLKLADADPVYLADEKILKVVHELIREGHRKDARDR